MKHATTENATSRTAADQFDEVGHRDQSRRYLKAAYLRRFFRRSFFETERRLAVDLPFIFGIAPVAIA